MSALSPSELTQALHAASNLSMDPNFDPVQVQQLLAAQGYSATEIATFLYLVQKQQMLNP